MHARPPKHFNLDNCLCVKTERTLRKDNTIAHDSRLYQIEDNVKTKKVTVEEKVDGSMLIIGGGASLKYKEIEERPKKEQNTPDNRRRFNRPYIPPKDHPWRKMSRRSASEKNISSYT